MSIDRHGYQQECQGQGQGQGQGGYDVSKMASFRGAVDTVQLESFTCIVCDKEYKDYDGRLWGTTYRGVTYLVCQSCAQSENKDCDTIIANKIVCAYE